MIAAYRDGAHPDGHAAATPDHAHRWPAPATVDGARGHLLLPVGDVAVEHVERHCAAAEHDVVESPDVELPAEILRRPGAQLLDLELADLVGQRLARPGDVAVDLVRDVELGLGGIGLEEIDRLLPGPALVMHPGVDHEPHGAPHFVRELAELVVRIGIQPHLLAKALAVEPPALGEGRELVVTAEHRQLAELLRERDLQVMTGHGLVDRQHRDLVDRAFLRLVQVYVVIASASPVDRGRLVVRSRVVRPRCCPGSGARRRVSAAGARSTA